MTTRNDAPRANRAAAVLSLTAVALLVALVFQAMGPWTPTARAEMAVKAGSYSAMTTRASSQDLLWLIDDANETLFVYGVSNNNREVAFIDRQSLKDLFLAARQRAGD